MEEQNIALGLKQLTPHPWDALDENLKVGDHVKGKVVVMFSSFNHISLRKILEISGNAVEVGALVLEDSIGGFPGYYCQQAGFACYHPPIEILTDENVRDCKEHGVKMNVWTVNDMAGLEQLHRWGCEGIITNFPGVASGWLRAQGE